EEFIIDDEGHVDAFDPAVLLRFVFKPLIQVGKFAVIEVPSCDADAIYVAAGIVERVVGQRAPEVDADEIPPKYRGEISGHSLKKVGQIIRDIHRGQLAENLSGIQTQFTLRVM